MNKNLSIGIVLSLFSVSILAQKSVENVIFQIEKNNTTLLALRKNTDANKIENKTGIYLQNPELTYSYLWGNPSSIGNRTDVSIKQSFDFPTAYAYRNQISDIKNEQEELDFLKQRNAIILQTRLICSNLIYLNALNSELTKRQANAQTIAKSYKAKFDVGEVNILEYNKSQLNLLNINKDIEWKEVEQNELLTKLASLNGGISIPFTEDVFQLQTIPADFEQWYVQSEQNNPVLKWIKQEITLSEKNVKLNTALGLPKFQAGYMSEYIVGQHFQGATIGLSIPLWENKNRVKYAKAKTEAMQNIESDNKLQFYNGLKTLHTKALSLQNNVNDYRKNLQQFNSSELLKKALDKGEISLYEYTLELSAYYESINKILELEKELNKTVAELNQYI
ncbi:MAG: TolC family protein [Paludibacter sp.]|nr:TolC family protein [Paludibacter sp.]